MKVIFEVGHSSQASLGDIPFKLLVSGVTKHWRRINLKTPRLWTRIISSIHPSKELELINTYLQRSAAYPFEVTFTINNKTYHSSWDMAEWNEPYRQLVDRLVIKCLYGTNEDDISTFFDFLEPLRAPYLTSFEITRAKDVAELASYELAEILTGGAPVLHCVHLVHLKPSSCDWLPALNHVRALHLVFTSQLLGPSFYDLLKSAPSLTHLEMRGVFFMGLNPSRPMNANLPMLQTLSVMPCNTTAGSSSILHRMSAPLWKFCALQVSTCCT